MPRLESVKVLVSIMMSFSFVEQRETIEVEAHLQGTAHGLIYMRLPAEDRQKYGEEDKVGRLVESVRGTQRCFLSSVTVVFFCVASLKTLARTMSGARDMRCDGYGAARRRRDRRLRSWWRHEQQSTKAAVTTALHHSRDVELRCASVATQTTDFFAMNISDN